MRKLFLLAVGLAMTLTACQKDEGLVSDGATSQTITVTIPQGMQTRATAADFGNGAKIDRCLLQPTLFIVDSFQVIKTDMGTI